MQHPKNDPRLFRVFSKENYLNDFLVGIIRLSRIDNFRDIEDPGRRDGSEGVAEYRAREPVVTVHMDKELRIAGQTESVGDLHLTAQFANPTYLFCTCDPEGLDTVMRSMGKFVAIIEDREAFASDIQRLLTEAGFRLAGPIRVEPVQYSKGDSLGARLTPFQNAQLSQLQKPAGYANEHEVRFIATLHQRPEDKFSSHILLKAERALAGTYRYT